MQVKEEVKKLNFLFYSFIISASTTQPMYLFVPPLLAAERSLADGSQSRHFD